MAEIWGDTVKARLPSRAWAGGDESHGTRGNDNSRFCLLLVPILNIPEDLKRL